MRMSFKTAQEKVNLNQLIENGEQSVLKKEKTVGLC